MNYIVFNEDGSIKRTNFTDSINQNSDGANQIFVVLNNVSLNDKEVVGVFVLPDGTVSEEVGVKKYNYEYEPNITGNGFLLTLTLNETKLAGLVFLTLQIVDSTESTILYTYRVALTINESAALASLTLISLAQYNALKNYIDTNFVKSVNYVPYVGAENNVNLGNYGLTASYVQTKAINIANNDYQFELDVENTGLSFVFNNYITNEAATVIFPLSNPQDPSVKVAYQSWVQSLGYATTLWVNTNYATKSEAKLYRHTITIVGENTNYALTLIIYTKNNDSLDSIEDLVDIYGGYDEYLNIPSSCYILGDDGIASYHKIKSTSSTPGYYHDVECYAFVNGNTGYQTYTYAIIDIYDTVEEVDY